MNKRRNNLIFDDNSIPDNQKPLLGNLYTHTSEKLTNENINLWLVRIKELNKGNNKTLTLKI